MEVRPLLSLLFLIVFGLLLVGVSAYAVTAIFGMMGNKNRR